MNKRTAGQDLPANIRAILKRRSPASEYLGLEFLDCDPANGLVRVAFDAGERHHNLWGGIQGGMIAAMMDDVLSLALGLDLEWGQITPTLELQTHFIAAVPAQRLVAEAHTIRRGRSVSFAEADLRTGSGELVATASATASIVTLKRRDGAKAKDD